MNSLERMHEFLNGGAVDRLPFMPILMRFCAKHTQTPYRNFILNPAAHCDSNIRCANDFRSDWVNVMSDPYGELEAYGAHIEYPEDSLPLDHTVLIEDIARFESLPELDLDHPRLRGRLEELRIFSETLGDTQVICGWVEGPVAEYCDLRSLGYGCLDFYDDPAAVRAALEKLHRNALRLAEAQVRAGANMIGIGDAACSQIGPELYREFAYPYECELVRHIHKLGALVKLHICGNTEAILPDMISTGADIIDVDHLVRDMAQFVPLLASRQALCGNLDPVGVIRDLPLDEIRRAARLALAQAPGKLILSGGCEITPDTPEAHLSALSDCCRLL